MERTATLKIDIRSYWHPGTGRGLGTQLDAVTHRASNGLPVLPGRTIKGLLREAVRHWEELGGYDDENHRPDVLLVDQLFGPSEEGSETWPGLLRFSDGVLPRDEAAYLSANPRLIAGLYRSHFSTSIDHESGTAKEKTLRGIELVVPMVLRGEVRTIHGARYRDLEGGWPEILTKALPLVRAVGAHRSRGLGRAVLSWEEGQ